MATLRLLLLLCIQVLTSYGVGIQTELAAAREVAMKYIHKPEVLPLVKKLEENVEKARKSLQNESKLLYNYQAKKEAEFSDRLQSWMFTLVSAIPEKINDFKKYLTDLKNGKPKKEVMKGQEVKEVEETFFLPITPTERESKKFMEFAATPAFQKTMQTVIWCFMKARELYYYMPSSVTFIKKFLIDASREAVREASQHYALKK